MFAFLRAKYEEGKFEGKQEYLRKRLTIFLSVEATGCTVSAGHWQILSRVTEELNKLEKENNSFCVWMHLTTFVT